MYILKLKFVEPDLKLHNLDLIDYSNDKKKDKSHFLDYAKELNGSKPTNKEHEQFLARVQRMEC